MGLIEDVPVPQPATIADTQSEETFNKYQERFYAQRDSSMAILKEYYESLLEAKYAVAAYIISLDHSDESLDFAITQLNMSLDNLKEVDDENKDDEEQVIKDNIELYKEFKKINESKRSKFNQIDSKLSTYIENTIAKNNAVDKAPMVT